MTERLSAMLHDEADTLLVPRVPTGSILAEGRGLRRRRRTGRGIAIVATLAFVGAGVTPLVLNGREADHKSRADAAAVTAYVSHGAFSTGRVVHIGTHQVTLPEQVQAIYYTSLGVLVRTGSPTGSGTPGPSGYVLVRPDGTTRTIDGLDLDNRVPGTDPDSPYLTYARSDGTQWSLIAVDLATGDEIARRTVDASFTWGGWAAPPVTTSGQRMWALFDDGWHEYDWAAGTVRTIPGTAHAPLEAAHGRFLFFRDTDADLRVYDFASDVPVRTILLRDGEYSRFSPDGRYVRLDSQGAVYGDGDTVIPPGPTRFVSVATGRSVPMPGGRFYGWTPDGHTLSVDPGKNQVTVCDPGTGSCQDIATAVGAGTVRLGGISYES